MKTFGTTIARVFVLLYLKDTWRFTYNDNDQLINIIHSADDYKEFTLTYKDSNISEIETITIVSQTTTRKKRYL